MRTNGAKCHVCGIQIKEGHRVTLIVSEETVFGKILANAREYVIHESCVERFDQTIRIKKNTLIEKRQEGTEGWTVSKEAPDRRRNIEWEQIMTVLALLRNRGGLKDAHWLETDPPDVELDFGEKKAGVEICAVSFAEQAKNDRMHTKNNAWQKTEGPASVSSESCKAEDIVKAIIHSIRQKEKKLPRWKSLYEEHWLIVNADLGIPSTCFGYWNQSRTKGTENERVEALLARVLIELEKEAGKAFHEIVICGNGWACELHGTSTDRGIPKISKAARELAGKLQGDWRKYRIMDYKCKEPLIVDGMRAAGTRYWTETRVKFAN